MQVETHAAITLLMESQRHKFTYGWGNFPMAFTKEEVMSESRQRVTSHVTKYIFYSRQAEYIFSSLHAIIMS